VLKPGENFWGHKLLYNGRQVILSKEVYKLKVGIFHPPLNVCGGAEWVAVNIINSLRKEGYRTVVLTNEKIDQKKMESIFGFKVDADNEIVFPLEIFTSTDLHNVYTDALRTLFLKTKCDLLIDTQSNSTLPGTDVTYIHFPILGRLKGMYEGGLRAAYFLPYLIYERSEAKSAERLILSNSKYTSDAIKKISGMNSSLLYPPISETFYLNPNEVDKKENVVVAASRIAPEKRLTLVPQVARLTSRNIRFCIVGLRGSTQELRQILTLIERNGVSDRVEVMTDVPRKTLQSILRKSKVYLHLAHGEHFGVSIVEAMASGCIPIVHNSGGPKEFVPESYRFNGLEEAARKIEKAVFEWTPRESRQIIDLARPFSQENFSTRFLEIFDTYVRNQLSQ